MHGEMMMRLEPMNGFLFFFGEELKLPKRVFRRIKSQFDKARIALGVSDCENNANRPHWGTHTQIACGAR